MVAALRLRMTVLPFLAITLNGCRTFDFNQSRIRTAGVPAAEEQFSCASNDSLAVAPVCLLLESGVKNPGKPNAQLLEILTKNRVECSTASNRHQADLLVSETSVSLKLGDDVVAESLRYGALEEALTKNKVLPVGSCESAFMKEMLLRQRDPEAQSFFQHEDGFVPEVLYRGTALADAEVAQILGPYPQNVVASWAYSKALQGLASERQDSSLSALRLREQIFRSLMAEWKVAGSATFHDAQMALVLPMANLRQEAIGKTLVGSERSQITARAFSASAAFYDSYSYAKMNISPTMIGLVLSYRNTPGRNLFVLENEWATFSHVPKADHIRAYLIVPKGDAVELSEQNGNIFYGYREGYEVYQVSGFGTQSDRGLRLARCKLDNQEIMKRPKSRKLPLCQSEVSEGGTVDGSLPQRLKDLLSKVPI